MASEEGIEAHSSVLVWRIPWTEEPGRQQSCCCWVTSVVSDSVRPHRRQPTRLPRPWDSPGKNTGVACHFLLQCMKVKVKVKSLSRVRPSAAPWTAAYQAPPSMGFSRQEYWSGVPLPSPGYSPGGCKELDRTEQLSTAQHSSKYMPTIITIARRIKFIKNWGFLFLIRNYLV